MGDERSAAALVRTAVKMLSAGAALALVAACASSPPTRFYTLSVAAPEATPPSGVGLITITGVSIPGEIDRPEIVRRVSPNQLSISELDRWAAPLDETIRRVLSDDIARRVPAPAPERERAVTVDIHDFYGDSSCNVTLRAVWTFKESSDQPAPAQSASSAQPAAGQGTAGGSLAGAARSTNEELRVPSSGACPATLPETMSVALGQLSDRIIAGAGR